MNIGDALKGIADELLKPLLKPLAKALFSKVLIPVLKEAAAKTATPLDDAVVSIIEKEGQAAIDKIVF